MRQGVLSFQYQEERNSTGMTALAGLASYLDLGHAVGLCRGIGRHVKLREGGQGWSDSQMINSLLLLNLAGGEGVDDLRILEKDEGLCRVLRKAETHGMSRRERGAQERRWRKERRRTVPSPSAVFRYLRDSTTRERKPEGKATLPSSRRPTKPYLGWAR